MKPTSTTGISDALPAPVPVCVRCVRLEEALREINEGLGRVHGNDSLGVMLGAILAACEKARAALAAVGEDEQA